MALNTIIRKWQAVLTVTSDLIVCCIYQFCDKALSGGGLINDLIMGGEDTLIAKFTAFLSPGELLPIF